MKKNWIIQKEGVDTNILDIEKEVKGRLKKFGFTQKDIKNITYYYNADEGHAYYVADLESGSDISGVVLKEELEEMKDEK